jgi:hypothetical protein
MFGPWSNRLSKRLSKRLSGHWPPFHKVFARPQRSTSASPTGRCARAEPSPGQSGRPKKPNLGFHGISIPGGSGGSGGWQKTQAVPGRFLAMTFDMFSHAMSCYTYCCVIYIKLYSYMLCIAVPHRFMSLQRWTTQPRSMFQM